MKNLSGVLIDTDTTIRQAVKQLNENITQILLVIDEQKKLIGTITDGDIRRALLNNINFDNPVYRVANKRPKFLYEKERNRVIEFMKEHHILHVPILNEDNQVIDIVLWKDTNKKEMLKSYSEKDNIVFILAGGKGSRLDPFTKILPKPLIPINDKPIIEIVMGNFKKCGFNNIFISLNYKSEMIKMYFKDNPQNFNITYVEEKEYLGTAGSLSLIKDKTDKSIIISNCDIILNTYFDEVINYHKKKGNDFTAIGIAKHIKIPYGVVKMKNGNLIDFIEKPEYDFIVNAGTYVIEPKIIDLVKKNEHIDMPDLIMRAKNKGYRIGIFPVSSGWIDIGQWEEYKEALKRFGDAGIIGVSE